MIGISQVLRNIIVDNQLMEQELPITIMYRKLPFMLMGDGLVKEMKQLNTGIRFLFGITMTSLHCVVAISCAKYFVLSSHI